MVNDLVGNKRLAVGDTFKIFDSVLNLIGSSTGCLYCLARWRVLFLDGFLKSMVAGLPRYAIHWQQTLRLYLAADLLGKSTGFAAVTIH